MIQDKKVSGIVVDTSIDAKTINYAVIGVGINANIDAAKLTHMSVEVVVASIPNALELHR